jgi:crossover junction endodeoxyribonuclease RusA
MLLEFLLPRRPISHQSKSSVKRQQWKDFVAAEARKAWGKQPAVTTACQLTLVYFCDKQPADIDDIIKPIQDALVGLVYVDDEHATDVDSHRRPLTDTFDTTRLPLLVLPALLTATECVYVRLSLSQPLESYL